MQNLCSVPMDFYDFSIFLIGVASNIFLVPNLVRYRRERERERTREGERESGIGPFQRKLFWFQLLWYLY